jgi:hypothetical protein
MIIYDLEIQKAIPPKDGNLLPDLKYCAGWSDYSAMGISAAVTYDTYRQEYRIFDEFMIEELEKTLTRAEMVCGFNIVNFDNNLLKANSINIPEAKTYDILREIARAAGTPNNYKGLGLNAVCESNFGTSKTGTGENAPMLYQFNRFGELFDYCLADVKLTKQILDQILACGHLKNPRDGKWIRVKRPS